MFLSFYEKRIRLQLLKSELTELKTAASQIANVDIAKDGSQYTTVTFDLSIINSVLAETYVLLSQNQELMGNLNKLRFHVRTINNEIELFFRRVSLPLSNSAELTAQHNQNMKYQCANVLDMCDSALRSLEQVLSVKG